MDREIDRLPRPDEKPKLRFNQWETKDGQKRSRLTVVVDTIDFMSQGNQSQNASANRPAAQTQQTPVVPDVPAVMDVYDEDIPF